MTNTNIQKICQLLKDAIEYKGDYAYGYIIKKCKKALDLLLCETCGGTGEIDRGFNIAEISTIKPAPDCQP